jgi:hypothetical protein
MPAMQNEQWRDSANNRICKAVSVPEKEPGAIDWAVCARDARYREFDALMEACISIAQKLKLELNVRLIYHADIVLLGVHTSAPCFAVA